MCAFACEREGERDEDTMTHHQDKFRGSGSRAAASKLISEKIQPQKLTILCGQSSAKVAPFHGGEEARRSSPLKDSARRMKEFWLESPENMAGLSNMASRSRPCDCGSPRAKPPRPELWPPADHRGFRAWIAAAAGKNALIA